MRGKSSQGRAVNPVLALRKSPQGDGDLALDSLQILAGPSGREIDGLSFKTNYLKITMCLLCWREDVLFSLKHNF